jgi:hypothetical protein
MLKTDRDFVEHLLSAQLPLSPVDKALLENCNWLIGLGVDLNINQSTAVGECFKRYFPAEQSTPTGSMFFCRKCENSWGPATPPQQCPACKGPAAQLAPYPHGECRTVVREQPVIPSEIATPNLDKLQRRAGDSDNCSPEEIAVPRYRILEAARLDILTDRKSRAEVHARELAQAFGMYEQLAVFHDRDIARLGKVERERDDGRKRIAELESALAALATSKVRR